jgi:hypothetical protein
MNILPYQLARVILADIEDPVLLPFLEHGYNARNLWSFFWDCVLKDSGIVIKYDISCYSITLKSIPVIYRL